MLKSAGRSLIAVPVGAVLVVAMLFLLFWNEGRAIKRARALAEGSESYIATTPDVVLPENEGKFVHFIGKADVLEPLYDSEFGIEVDAIRLKRTVKMYQWKESERRVSSGSGNNRTEHTEYNYSKVWSEDLIDSSNFHRNGHENPNRMPFQSRTFTSNQVRVGRYSVPDSLITKINVSESLPFFWENLPESIRNQSRIELGSESQVEQLYLPYQMQLATAAEGLTNERQQSDGPSRAVSGVAKAVASGGLDESETKNTQASSFEHNEEIGDLRIAFEATLPCEVTIMSGQVENTLEPYQTKNGALHMLRVGTLTPEEMIAKAVTENTILTWVLRAVGSALTVLGVRIAISPLTSLTGSIPFVGRLINTGFNAVAMLVGLGFSLITISIGWLIYRPLIGIPLLVLGIALLAYLFRRGGSKTESDSDMMDGPPILTPSA